MPENLPISVEVKGKEAKVEAKYSLQDLGTEITEVQNRVNKKIEDLVSERVREILANPPKKWMGMRVDSDAVTKMIDQHTAAMDALVKGKKAEIATYGSDLNLEMNNFGEALAKEVKAAVNAKIGEVVDTAEKRGIGEVVGGGAKEATKSYAQRLEDAANAK